MSMFNREKQKSVRVVMPLSMYEALKERCEDYGDLSRIVRKLIREWLKTDPPKAARLLRESQIDDSTSD